MTPHDLVSHGLGWRCVVYHAVFQAEMLLEEILASECRGNPLDHNLLLALLSHAETPIRKGERLIDAWRRERGEGRETDL